MAGTNHHTTLLAGVAIKRKPKKSPAAINGSRAS